MFLKKANYERYEKDYIKTIRFLSYIKIFEFKQKSHIIKILLKA